MNIERNNETDNEVEYVDNSTNLITKKSRQRKIIIFVACLLFSFVVWCYANYLDDPIIKKDISIDLHNHISDVVLTVYDEDGNKIDKIEIYGEESNVNSIGNYRIEVYPSDFKDGSTYIHKIELNDGVYSHTKEIKIVITEK